MKCVIVDNEPDTVSDIAKELRVKNFARQFPNPWELIDTPCPDDFGQLQNCVNAVLAADPDVILQDVALTYEEEAALDLLGEDGRVQASQFMGLSLVKELHAACPEIPIVVLTRNASRAISQIAPQLGAYTAIPKDVLARHSIQDKVQIIEEAVKGSFCHSMELFRLIRDSIKGSPDHIKDVNRALRRFYCNRSPVRRFTLLCRTISPWISKVLRGGQSDLVDSLIHRLVDTHTLLTLTDKSHRDHVRHSGNVFWSGYYFLHRITSFSPAQLKSSGQFSSDSFASEDAMKIEDQLLNGWTLASLFHDIAYADEKQDEIGDLFQRVLPNARIDLDSNDVLKDHLETLIDYVTDIQGRDGLASALRWVHSNWGKSCGDKGKPVPDHGVLGAVYLMDCFDKMSVSAELRPLLNQVALAVAVHHLPEWEERWGDSRLDVKIPFARFPLCALLAICDAIQNWDRSGNEPPPSTSNPANDKTCEDAYVKEATLTKVEVKDDPATPPCSITASISYSVAAGNSFSNVCEDLESIVRTWIDRGLGGRMLHCFSMEELFSVTLEYHLPTRTDPITCTFP